MPKLLMPKLKNRLMFLGICVIVLAICLFFIFTSICKDGKCSLGNATIVPTFQISVMKDGSGNGTFYGIVKGKKVFTCDENCFSIQYYSAPKGTVITIYAIPDKESAFVGWTGRGCSGKKSPCSLKVDSAKGVRSRFDIVQEVTLSVLKDGLGNGSFYGIVGTKKVFTCDENCADAWYDAPQGTIVKIYAKPDKESVFTGWTGRGCSGKKTPCVLTMDYDKGVRPRFDLKN